MAEFHYEATDRDGVARSGIVTAETIEQAINQLMAQGLNVLRVELARAGEVPLEITEFLTPLSESAAANVAGLLSDAVASKLPLEQALRAAAEDAPRAEARVLRQIASNIARGVPPHEAFQHAGDALPPHLVALIRAGFENGDLARLLSRYVTLSRQRLERRRPLLLAVTYPLVLFVGMAGVLLYVLAVLVPGFRSLYEDFGVQLPLLTRGLLSASDFVVSVWPPLLLLLGLFAALWGGYWLLMRRGWTLSSLPVFELFVRSADWGRFCGLLGLLVEGRQPLPQALRLAGNSAATPRVRAAGLMLADDLEVGLNVGDTALPRTMPAPIRQVFRWADRPEIFAEALAGLAELYEQRARISPLVIGFFLEPLALLIVAGTICLVVLALFGPLFTMLNALS
jgi:type II secretory pathway component PulF